MKPCLMPGCTAPTKPKGDSCKDAHRATAHRKGSCWGGVLPADRKRAQDAAAKRAARSQGVIPSEVRLSYEKTIRVLAAHFEDIGMVPEVALESSEPVLCRGLPGAVAAGDGPRIGGSARCWRRREPSAAPPARKRPLVASPITVTTAAVWREPA